MAFNWFKKKEVIDLRKGDSDIIVSDDVKKRFNQQASAGTVPEPSAPSSTTGTSQESGGFFSFFGSSNASNVSSMQTPAATETSTASGYGNSNTEIMDKLERLDKRINELFTGISRLTDRVDLNERKIERLERKTGVSDNY